MNEDKRRRDDSAVKILAHLFKVMCAADPELEDEQSRRQLSPAYFAKWLQENIDLQNGVEICGQLDAQPEAWDFVQQVGHSGNMLPIINVWPRIVLGEERTPKHPLVNMHLLAILEWEDGKIVPISTFTPREFVPKATFTDGIVASMFNQQISTAVKTVMDTGLDGLHEHSADTYGGESVFNVLMGAMLKVIPQLDPKLQPYLHKWMRLFQGFIRPPVPPEVQKHINAVRAEVARRAGQKPTGGWDS